MAEEREPHKTWIDLDARGWQAEARLAASAFSFQISVTQSADVIGQLRSLFGGNRAIVNAMDLSGPDAPSPEAAMRMLQRYGTGAKQTRGIGPQYRDRLARIVPAGRPELAEALREGRTSARERVVPKRGRVWISWEDGTIVISDDDRDREIPPQPFTMDEWQGTGRVEPEEAARLRPVTAMRRSYKIPPFGGAANLTFRYEPPRG